LFCGVVSGSSLIFVGWASGPEGAFPSPAWRPVRGDDGLWSPDAARVTDPDQWNLHKKYTVIAL
jgi:hypothetical protein